MTESRTDTALGLGERLRSARKARAVTLEQASQALRIEVPILQALEENRFDDLGAPVFVRGHLRAYARLLGLSEDTVLAAYRAAVPGSDVPPRVARERERPITSGPGAGSVVTLLFVVAALVGAFWLTREEAPAPVTEPVEAPAEAGPALPPSLEAAPASEPAPGAAPGASATGLSAADVPPSGRRRLTLEFVETAWVEISDRSGRLLAGEQPAGARHELSGEPPFDIVLGNRDGVRLSLDGIPVAYPGEVAGRRVARFRLPAPDAENGDG